MKLARFLNKSSFWDDITLLNDTLFWCRWFDKYTFLTTLYKGHTVKRWYSSSITFWPLFTQYLQKRNSRSTVPLSLSIASLWFEHLNFDRAVLWCFNVTQDKYVSTSKISLIWDNTFNFLFSCISVCHCCTVTSFILRLNILRNSSLFPTPCCNHTLPKPYMYNNFLTWVAHVTLPLSSNIFRCWYTDLVIREYSLWTIDNQNFIHLTI